LFSTCSQGVVYDDGNLDLEFYDKNVLKILKKKGKKYKFVQYVDLFKKEYVSFWVADGCSKGSLVWETSIKKINLPLLFQKSFDPFIRGNLGSTMSKSAIRYANRVTSENLEKIIFGLSACDGLESKTIFMSPLSNDTVVGLAVTSCNLEKSYMFRYSEPE